MRIRLEPKPPHAPFEIKVTLLDASGTPVAVGVATPGIFRDVVDLGSTAEVYLSRPPAPGGES